MDRLCFKYEYYISDRWQFASQHSLANQLSANIAHARALIKIALATASRTLRVTVHHTLGLPPDAVVFASDMLLDIPFFADLIHDFLTNAKCSLTMTFVARTIAVITSIISSVAMFLNYSRWVSTAQRLDSRLADRIAFLKKYIHYSWWTRRYLSRRV